MDIVQEQALSAEVESLINKAAIAQISASDGFFSPVFVVAKKDGGWRLVINLKALNQYICNPHFKMESIASLKDIIHSSDYMGRLDLKDAYLTVPVAKPHRRYLRFQWGDRSFEFQTLPFGLASAPRVFTKLLRPVAARMRRKGIRLLIYLDDILVMARGEVTLRRHLAEVVETLSGLGFVINLKKSLFNPTQDIDFLGFRVDSRTMMLTLPQEKVEKIKKECQHTLNQNSMSARKLAHLIGLLTSTSPAINPAPLHYRALQRNKNVALRNTGGYDCPVKLLPEAREDLIWWVEKLPQWNGRNIIPPTPEVVLTSDASREGWGATYQESQTGGMWMTEERRLHINVLELKAAFLALQLFVTHRRRTHVLIRIDNTTAIAYLNKKGGTHSRVLSDLAVLVWEWCLSRQITLQAEHIPGRENTDADRESRKGTDSSDWMLHPEIFMELDRKWGRFDVDLFAARHNTQLPRYFSYHLDPLAEAVDALSQPWMNMTPYAFPPFILLGRVLQKIWREKVHQVVVVAPIWPNQHWYPLLLESAVDYPVELPQIPDLLADPSGESHILIEQNRLRLAAWRVSGKESERENFQRRLSVSSQHHGDRERRSRIPVHGSNGVAGVRRGGSILFQKL